MDRSQFFSPGGIEDTKATIYLSQTRPAWDCHRTADQARGGLRGSMMVNVGIYSIDGVYGYMLTVLRLPRKP